MLVVSGVHERLHPGLQPSESNGQDEAATNRFRWVTAMNKAISVHPRIMTRMGSLTGIFITPAPARLPRCQVKRFTEGAVLVEKKHASGWSDEPATSIADDQFGRDTFAKMVATRIDQSLVARPSTVFGLVGP